MVYAQNTENPDFTVLTLQSECVDWGKEHICVSGVGNATGKNKAEKVSRMLVLTVTKEALLKR